MALNILQLATVDNGGATWFYRDAIRAHTRHRCRAVRMYQGWIDYPVDVLAPDKRRLKDLLTWADVIHLHDEAGALVGKRWRHKPVIVTYHGTRYRRAPAQYRARCDRRGWRLTVSTLDLATHGGTWIPTPRRDVSGDWQPAHLFVVCHAPTNRERKRTDVVIEAVRQAAGCRLRLIEGTPYRKAMQRKAVAHCLVDGFHYGYGNNAVEAWAFGMPVVSGAYPKVEAQMRAAWGSLPFVAVDPDVGVEALADVLARLRADAAFYAEAQARGRAHYERWHRPDRVAAVLCRLYEEAIG